MKKVILLFFLLLPVVMLLAQADSSAYQGKAGIGDVAEEDPGLFIFMMIFLLGLVVAIVACLAAAAVLTLFTLLMMSVGIVSVAVFMAWYKRSIYTGVKWLVYLSFSIAGMAGVTFVCLLLHRLGDTGYTLQTMLSWGLPAGLFGGLLGGWVLLTASRALYRHFVVNSQ